MSDGCVRAHKRTASVAFSRLRYILAKDRVQSKTRRPFTRDYTYLFLDRMVPVMLLEKFPRVEAMPKNSGQVIKWRKSVPFNVEPCDEQRN